MDRITLRQAALLLVRFFGLYLVFYGVLGLLDAPGYWMRSTFSHPHSPTHSVFDTSSDVSLLMYYFREAAHFVIGFYLARRPRKWAQILMKPIADAPEI